MDERPQSAAATALRALQRLRPLLMPAVYLAFTLVVFWKVWTPIDGARGFWRYDPRHEYWGDLGFQVDTLRHGVVAMWNPFDRCGFPIYGDPQPGLLYPGNWLLIAIGLLAGGVGPALVAVKILAHWAFGAIGMHLFLRRLGAREPACYAGGLLYGWTCPRMRYGGSALNWSMAWIPWVLLATDWFAEKPGPRRAIVLGSTAAMVLLSGAPAVTLYLLLIAVPWGLWALRGRLRPALRWIGLAAVVAAAWVLPLVASNLEQLPESVRQQRDLDFIAHSAFGPGQLIGLLVPRLSEQNFYFGFFALLCAGAAVAAAIERRRALLWLGVAAGGVLLGLGANAGVLPAAASALPPFQYFRQAHRYIYIAEMALAVVAAIGFDRLLAVDGERARRVWARSLTWIGGAATFALAVAWLVSVAGGGKVDGNRSDALALGTLSALIATVFSRGLVTARGRGRTALAWAAVVFVAVDVWTANAKIASGGMTPPPRPQRDQVVAQLGDVAREWRVYDREFLEFRPGTRLGIRDFSGYEDDPLGLSRYTRFRDAARRNPALLGHANVRWVLDPSGKGPLPPGASKRRPGVFEVAEVAPAVMYVPAAEVAAGPEQALQRLAAITPGQGAVVEGAAPPLGPAGATPVAGRFTVYQPDRIEAEIDTPGPGLVVIAEAYYPAWRATVDGEPVTVQPANELFRGVPVSGAGHHVITMELAPRRFWALLPLHLGALIALLAAVSAPLWARLRRRGRRRTSRGSGASAPTAGGSA